MGVFCCVLWQLAPYGTGDGRHNVDLRNKSIRHGPSFGNARPFHDERHVVTAFVDVALQAPQRVRRPVPKFFIAGVGIFLWAIIGGKNHDRIIGLPRLFQPTQEPTAGVVGFVNKITVGSGF